MPAMRRKDRRGPGISNWAEIASLVSSEEELTETWGCAGAGSFPFPANRLLLSRDNPIRTGTKRGAFTDGFLPELAPRSPGIIRGKAGASSVREIDFSPDLGLVSQGPLQT